MKKKLIVTIVTVAIILIISTFVTNNLFGRITITLFAGGIFILQGLRRIDEDPPHKGILTVLGERQTRTVTEKNEDDSKKDKKEKVVKTLYLNEGLNFFPFYPFAFGYVPVNVERKPFDIEVTTRTPDRAQVKIRISLTLRPLPKHLINYEDSGGFEGVKQHLKGEIEERVREWAEGLQEGPWDWREIYQAKLEAASILIKRVAGNGLFDIPEPIQEIPTYILFRYFSVPRVDNLKKVTKNERPWVKNKWEKVRDILEKAELQTQNWEEPLTEKVVKERVKKREKQVQDIRSGEGKIEIVDLGMTLERLNISDVEVTGEAGKVADMEAKEREEREAETLEIKHLSKQVKLLVKNGYTLEKALEIMQTERGKITKSIDEKALNISAETRELVKNLGDKALKNFFKKGGI